MTRLNCPRRLVGMALVLVATGLAIRVSAAPPAPIPADEPLTAPTLSFGPVEGLTTRWHAAPAELPVPADYPVYFVATKHTDGNVSWSNAVEFFESSAISLAVCAGQASGEATVRAALLSDDGEVAATECLVRWLDVDVATIQVTAPALSVNALGSKLPNDEAMRAYFGDSIAELGTAKDGSRVTSVDNEITGTVSVTPPEIAPLVEWRVDGVGVSLGTTAKLRFADPGQRSIAVGPPGALAPVVVTCYRVVMLTPAQGEALPDMGPITGTAITVPGGFEDRITWLAATRFGSATPQTGRGPTFTAEFSDITGYDPTDPTGEIAFWGLKADNDTRGERRELIACQLVATLGFRDACGRSLFDPTPNGWNEPFPIFLGGPGSNDDPCPFTGPTGGEVLTEKYTVTGKTLEEVGEAIFGVNGAGPPMGGRHFAGSATLRYEVVWRSAGRDARGNICVEVADIRWTITIRLPDWDAPEGTSQAALDEFARFRLAVQTHEQGHANIFNAGMPGVRSAFVGVQPPRKICVPGQTRYPKFNADGTPATTADAAIANAINAALSAQIDGSPQMQGINQQGMNYDAPPSAGNPSGTDHGRTQGATLDMSIAWVPPELQPKWLRLLTKPRAAA